MFFISLLILVTLSIAGVAAFFSIVGLAAVFSGSFWAIVLMGSVLEAGKLIAASFVYRYWQLLNILMRIYLIAAIIVLMVVTSAGIFGFLSAAHQKDALPMELNIQQIVLLTDEKAELDVLKQERLDRKKQIDADIAALPNNFITGRKRLMDAYGPELIQLRDDIRIYTEQIREKTLKLQELKNTKLEQEVHIGPITFIAKLFDETTTDTIKWFIILIMFAFDPLAVVLTLGINIALMNRQQVKVHKAEQELVDHPEYLEQLLDQADHTIDSDEIDRIKKELEELRKPHEATPDELKKQQDLAALLKRQQLKAQIRQ